MMNAQHSEAEETILLKERLIRQHVLQDTTGWFAKE